MLQCIHNRGQYRGQLRRFWSSCTWNLRRKTFSPVQTVLPEEIRVIWHQQVSLKCFLHGILASVLFYAVVLGWQPDSGGQKQDQTNRMSGGFLEVITEQRTRKKLRAVLSHDHQHSIFVQSGRSERLLLPSCSMKRFRRSVIPAAARFLIRTADLR